MKSFGDWFFGFLIGVVAGILVTACLQAVSDKAVAGTCAATCQSKVYAQRTDGACLCVGQEVTAGGKQP